MSTMTSPNNDSDSNSSTHHQSDNHRMDQERDDHWASCLMAFQFLTRLPVPSPGVLTNRAAGRSLLYYPLVGLAIGILLLMLASLLSQLVPHLGFVHAFVILVIWVFLTGGLHLDGLADSADAWVGGLGDRERSLAIMKDPYAGPAAVAVVVLVLLGKWVFLAALLTQGVDYWWLAPVVARLCVVFLMTWTPYVREEGLGSVLSQHCPKKTTKHLLIAALLLTLLFVNWLAVVLVLLVLAGLRGLMIKRLGGTTGDTAGASLEIIEWVFLFGLLL